MRKLFTFVIEVLVIFCLITYCGLTAAIAETKTYSSFDVPIPTIDNGAIISGTEVPCDAGITDLNVQINIDHDNLEALDIYLIAPNATFVELTTDNGGGIAGSYADTIFDDEASISITAGSSPFTGSFKPEGSLVAFDGMSSGGVWNLLVIDDDLGGDTGILNSWSMTIESPDAPTTIFTSIPLAIPDSGTMTSAIASCVTGKIIADVNVQIDISHTWDEDLDIYLIAPDGTSIELTTDNGSPGANYSGTIFDDEAADSITTGTAPFTGSYQPEGLLSALDGMLADGTWTLEVTDDLALETGILHSWSLIFEYTDHPTYSFSTYVDDLPVTPAGLTVDPRTGTFYFAEFGACAGVLRKIAPDGSVSTITSDFTPNGTGGCLDNFYPYILTDIQFLNGAVYVPLAEGELARIYLSTGTTTIEHTFANFAVEGGIEHKKGQLLVTSGLGTATEIQSYSIGSQSAATVVDVSPLSSVNNVKYDPVHNKVYFGSGNSFYQADLSDGTYTAIPAYATTFSATDFAVSPDGNYLLVKNNTGIDLVSIADGSSTTLLNSLFGVRHDMVFAPSSSGGGCSLYVANISSILEISSFEGRCRPFPWGMFLPAITGGGSSGSESPQ